MLRLIHIVRFVLLTDNRVLFYVKIVIMDVVLLVIYIISSVGGATLIKYSTHVKITALFTVPVVNMSISWMTLLGMLGYGFSFCLYIILLSKLDLSFLTPVATAAIYTLLMLVSFFIFSETFTLWKVIGCVLILAGVILVILNK